MWKIDVAETIACMKLCRVIVLFSKLPDTYDCNQVLRSYEAFCSSRGKVIRELYLRSIGRVGAMRLVLPWVFLNRFFYSLPPAGDVKCLQAQIKRSRKKALRGENCGFLVNRCDTRFSNSLGIICRYAK